MYLKYKYPHAPLLGVGFSLGANVLTRYLAEEGEQSRLIAGCALACVRLVSGLFIWNIWTSNSYVLALEHSKECSQVCAHLLFPSIDC